MSNTSTCDCRTVASQLLALAMVFGLLLATALARAATTPPAEPLEAPLATIVAGLVHDALLANLELDIAGAAAAERLAALDAARARYLPALDLGARYSRADGGRTIDFPVGNLLNPVYASLNQLTGTTNFPSVANQSIHLLRPREQDTHLTLTQPLYDARLPAASAARGAEFAAATAARDALAGRVERDMATAYYRWLEAGARSGILDATLELAEANLRVNQSLFDTGKITPDRVFRAEADVLEVQQTRLAATNAERLAQSYVNLLRNAPFDRPLPRAQVADADVSRARDALAQRLGALVLAPAALADAAIGQRAELRQLDAAAAAADAGARLARAAFKPQLALAVDAGSQGERYAFGANDRYVLASLVLRFNLFDGGADQAGLAAAHAAGRAARSNRALAEQRVRLEVEQALDALQVSLASLGTSAKRVEAARGGFRIAERKRDLGQINQAEFVDARRVLTDAELNRNVTRYAALGSVAELEYAVGRAARAPTPESLP